MYLCARIIATLYVRTAAGAGFWGVFSCPESAVAKSLCITVLHCSILFLFGKNYLNID
jgi:hypothetical protein